MIDICFPHQKKRDEITVTTIKSSKKTIWKFCYTINVQLHLLIWKAVKHTSLLVPGGCGNG